MANSKKIQVNYDSLPAALQKFSNIVNELNKSDKDVATILGKCKGLTKDKAILFGTELKALEKSLVTLTSKTKTIIERAGVQFPEAERQSKAWTHGIHTVTTRHIHNNASSGNINVGAWFNRNVIRILKDRHIILLPDYAGLMAAIGRIFIRLINPFRPPWDKWCWPPMPTPLPPRPPIFPPLPCPRPLPFPIVSPGGPVPPIIQGPQPPSIIEIPIVPVPKPPGISPPPQKYPPIPWVIGGAYHPDSGLLTINFGVLAPILIWLTANPELLNNYIASNRGVGAPGSVKVNTEAHTHSNTIHHPDNSQHKDVRHVDKDEVDVKDVHVGKHPGTPGSAPDKSVGHSGSVGHGGSAGHSSSASHGSNAGHSGSAGNSSSASHGSSAGHSSSANHGSSAGHANSAVHAGNVGQNQQSSSSFVNQILTAIVKFVQRIW